jgi:tetratricopeptide (TPR) repeat protein
MYRYSMSKVSLPLRLAARLAGITGSRERGLRLVEEAAAYPSDAQTGAMFISVVIYNREERYDDALRVIRELQRRYPRNRLLWLESGTTAIRAGRAQAARTELEHGLAMLAADSRPRAFGEEARWRLSHGMALLSLDRDEAARELRAALVVDGPDWVRGRAHRELGKLADLEGHHARALEEYRMAVRLCRAGNDRLCSDDANRLIRTPYR